MVKFNLRISDPHVNIEGFLEGSRESPLSWSLYQPSIPFTQAEIEKIQLFKRRARTFLNNLKDLKLPSRQTLTTKNRTPKIRIATNIYPGEIRAKSLYMDFRFLIAQNEKSNAKNIINTLKRRSQGNDLMLKFLKQIKSHFIGSDDFSFNANAEKINLEKLINLKFNTEYFHSGANGQIEEIKHINDVFEEASIQELLFWAIYEKWYSVQCLYTAVKDIDSEISSIYCPDPRIVI